MSSSTDHYISTLTVMWPSNQMTLPTLETSLAAAAGASPSGVVVVVINTTFASSAPSACYKSISETFSVLEKAAGLTVTLFILGFCASLLIFAPLGEFFRRRWILYTTFGLYLAFNFLCAFALNFRSLLVGSFLTGTLVSALLTNSPGVLADL